VPLASPPIALATPPVPLRPPVALVARPPLAASLLADVPVPVALEWQALSNARPRNPQSCRLFVIG
jgi:hypothetical protein